jgi:hypothetical protein
MSDTMMSFNIESALIPLVRRLVKDGNKGSRASFLRGLVHAELRRQLPKETARALRGQQIKTHHHVRPRGRKT